MRLCDYCRYPPSELMRISPPHRVGWQQWNSSKLECSEGLCLEGRWLGELWGRSGGFLPRLDLARQSVKQAPNPRAVILRWQNCSEISWIQTQFLLIWDNSTADVALLFLFSKIFDMISTFSRNSKGSSSKFYPRIYEIKAPISFTSIYKSVYLQLFEI